VLELFAANAYSSFASHNLVKVRFVLDDQSYPVGFHLCRGSDNQMFRTNSLSEDELTRSLTCHFSRLSCGSNLESDLVHLKFLHDKGLISTIDYASEKRNLTTQKASAKLYILPLKPAHIELKKVARWRILFTIFCILLLGAILLCAYRFSYESITPTALPSELLLKR